jgi:hypothetical protein
LLVEAVVVETLVAAVVLVVTEQVPVLLAVVLVQKLL